MPAFRSTSAAAIATAVVLAACGGSSSTSGVSPSAYVKSVCSAVGSFRKEIQDKSRALSASSLTNPRQGKAALQAFVSASASGADVAVSRLKDAGSPNIASGKSISSSIVGSFTQLSSAFKQTESSVNALSTSSPAAFKSGARSVYGELRPALSGLLTGLSGLTSPALQQAAKKEPACQTLGG
jgi:hypothetical protein